MNRTRVLVLISGLSIGSSAGGAERYGIEIARHLDRKTIEPIVCAFWRRGVTEEGYWTEELTAEGIECFLAVERGRGFDPLRYLRAIRSILAHLGGRDVDVIHSHFQLGSVTALVLRRRVQARALIRTAHGSVRWEWRDTWLGSLCRSVFTKGIFPACFDAEVGVSLAAAESLDRRLLSRLWGRHAPMIGNAIDPARFQAGQMDSSARAQFGLSPDDIVVGSVGRLSEQKGYRYLVEAAPLVLQAIPGCRFLLVGDGELREDLRRQVDSLGLASAFIFAGARNDVASMYAAMDVFVCPSLYEGLPTVILESMASGIPIVATDIAGTQELITDGQTGWLARSRDSAHLAQLLIDVLHRADRGRSVARNALMHVVPRHSIQEAARRYEELYRRVLAPPGHID
ncbi:MAG: glycosyltransferase [Anaerolineae bacterium]